MEWWNEFGNVFFLGVATLFFGAVSMGIRYCLKSKCDIVRCGCCGCFLNVHRQTGEEQRETDSVEESKV
jgi:cell division protein FtsW (lipid II flippase)